MKKLMVSLLFLSMGLLSFSQQSWSSGFPASATMSNKDQWRNFWDDFGLGLYNSSGGQFTSSPITSKDGILTIPFNPGDWGGSPSRNAGAIIYQSEPRFTSDVAYLEYEVKFGPNFDWGSEGEQYRGGKFGMSIQVGDVGVGSPPNRGNFSFTTMWRDGGNLDCYFYYSEQSGNWPDRRIYYKAQRDRWYKFAMEVKLNSPGKQDGELRIYIDGKVEYVLKNLILSNSGNGKDQFKFAFGNFFGGDSGSWASRTQSNIQYKDIKVYNYLPSGGPTPDPDPDPEPECEEAGTPCDDGNPETTDDVEDGECNCQGEVPQPPVEEDSTEIRIDVGSSSDRYVEGGTAYKVENSLGGVYETERYGAFSYNIPLDSAGKYVVTLYMASQWNGASEEGQRVFDITIEDQAIQNLDLVKEFGHKVAGSIELEVEADEMLNLSFIPKVQNPLLNGLVVRAAESDTVIVDPPVVDSLCEAQEVIIENLQMVVDSLSMEIETLVGEVVELTAENLVLATQVDSLSEEVGELLNEVKRAEEMKKEAETLVMEAQAILQRILDLGKE